MADPRVTVTLTFATNLTPTNVATAVVAAVGKEVPDELIGVNWHSFDLDGEQPADTTEGTTP
jgi:hypothetical protein